MDLKVTKIPIFTEEVYAFNLPNFKFYQEQIKQIVLVEENGLDTSPELECNVKARRTAWNSHLRYPALNNLSFEIKKYLESFIESEGYDIPELKIQDCWINWYKKNQFAQPHKHNSVLSVVLFVDVQDTDAKFFFHADKRVTLVKKNEIKTNFNSIKNVNAKNGTVLFFDGMISHSVSPNVTNKNRITVAFNYAPVYLEDRSDY